MTEQPLGSTYTLTDKIGAGAMGTVYRGRDKHGTPFAFKLLRPEFAEDAALVQRFLQERSALTRVDHANVVRMHDLVVEGGTLAIVMDLVEGGDLRQLLAAAGTLAPGQVADLSGQIAAGLAAVHEAGLVHRDVKPENVLIEMRGGRPMPKVSDFGIARLADAAAATRSTMMLGTPNYVAPEITEGRIATGAADTYSLGIMIYELCSGVTPFEGGSHLAVIRRHGDATPPRPDGIPDPLWAAIRDMLAKDPDQRPTAAQVGPYLSNLAVNLQGHPAAPQLTEPLSIAPPVATGGRQDDVPPVAVASERERPRRRSGALLAGGLAGLLVLGGSGYLATQALRGDDESDKATVPAGDPVAGTASGTPTTSAPDSSESAPSTAAAAGAPAAASVSSPRTSTAPESPTTAEAPAVMPEVVGVTLSRARSELRGVTVEVVEEFDADATDNEVLAQSVTAGQALPEQVELTVARQPVTVYVDALDSVDMNNLYDETAEMNGEQYPRSLVGSWSSGYREWNLSRGYRQLVSTVGRSDDASVADEQVQVEVFLDQRKVWSERAVLGETIDMDIDVTDALRLRIEFTSLNDENADLVLGDIHLLGLPGEVPEPEDE